MRFASLEARKVPKYLQQFPKKVLSILSICISRSEYLSIMSICGLQNSYMETLTHSMIVSGDGDFGRHLAYESKALMNGVSVLIKETSRPLSAFCCVRIQREVDRLQHRNEFSPEPERVDTLTSHFQSPEL